MSRAELDRMTWEEVDNMDRDKTIFFLPVSPLEEHGPHLPLGTDYYGARDIAGLAIEKLNEKDPSLNYILIPAIPLGCTEMTMDFPGTISVRGKTLMRLIYDVGSSIARHGFKYLVISNHLDPVQVKAISVARKKLMRKYAIKVFEPASAVVFSRTIKKTKLWKTGAATGVKMDTEAHADIKETSFIQHKYPELLRESYRGLPPVRIDIGKSMMKGMRKLKKMGAGKGYIGTPAKATLQLGKIHLEEGAEILADSAMKLYKGERLPEIGKGMRFVLRFFVRLN